GVRRGRGDRPRRRGRARRGAGGHLASRPGPVLRGRVRGVRPPRRAGRWRGDRRGGMGGGGRPRRPRACPGDRMPLLARTVNTPLAIEIRRGAVAQLGAILADRRISAGGGAAAGVCPGPAAVRAERRRPQRGAADVLMVSGGTLDAAQELGEKLRKRPYDAVVGIGGGKTLDTAKWAASRYGLPMVSVATSLAHDGLASPTASLWR